MKQPTSVSLAESHKILVLCGALLGAIVATVLLFFLAQNKVEWTLLPLLAFVGPALGAFLARKLADKKGQKAQEETEEVFGGSKFGATQKSKFAPEPDDFSLFALIVSALLAYLVVYFSEVLNLTVTFQNQYPTSNFIANFLEVTVNILQVDWASAYLVRYWIFLTIFIVASIISWFYYSWKINRARKKQG